MLRGRSARLPDVGQELADAAADLGVGHRRGRQRARSRRVYATKRVNAFVIVVFICHMPNPCTSGRHGIVMPVWCRASVRWMARARVSTRSPGSCVASCDPLSGYLFVFVNRRHDSVKVLYWECDGLAQWSKRLEQAHFAPCPDGSHVQYLRAMMRDWVGTLLKVLNPFFSSRLLILTGFVSHTASWSSASPVDSPICGSK